MKVYIRKRCDKCHGHGKIAAVVRRVSGKHFECVSAELVAVDLFRIMYEQSFIEEI